MSNVLRAALAYARAGCLVFPIHGVMNGRCTCGRRDCSSPGKHPLVRSGVRDATTDERVIAEWWKRWRSANVAVATGRSSGLVVVDIDVPEGDVSLGVLEAIGRGLPPTLTARTGSGGRHLYYRAPDHALGNAVGGLPGINEELTGIDLRADGGYVLAPPSAHISGIRYRWEQPVDDLDGTLDETLPNLCPAPHWLREPPRPAPLAASEPASFSGEGSAYGLAVLEGELDRLRSAPKGRRNHTLNRAAFAVARVISGGELLESAARAALLTGALQIGLTEHEFNLTIDSAFRAGVVHPRSAPHRRARQKRIGAD